MNPFIKNCRTGFHNDMLNRTSHYCKLLICKPTVDNRLEHEHTYLLDQKGQKQINNRRLRTNYGLMRSLVDIDRRSGTYRSFSQEQVARKKSLKNQYLERQKSLAVSDDNTRLYRKILSSDTEFSQQKIKGFDRKITRYSKLIRHPFREICEMDKEFYRTYRHQLIRAQLSPPQRNTVGIAPNPPHPHPPLPRKNRKLRKLRRQAQPEKSADDNPE